MGDKLRRRKPRLIRSGDPYTAEELDAGEVQLDLLPMRADAPPEEIRGEPWGWTKGKPYPRGYRADGIYGPKDLGPYDGSWDPRGER